MIVIAILALALAIVALGYAVKAYKKKRELVYEIEVEKKQEDTPQNEDVSDFEQDPRKVINKRVWELRDADNSQQVIANVLGVSRTTVRRELKKGRLYE